MLSGVRMGRRSTLPNLARGAFAVLSGVAFVGVNIRDDAATARSFEKQHEVEYASILDVQDAAVTLAFAKPAPPSTTPTTFLLDREGRVAARFTSAIDPRVSVVSAMIDDLLAEK